MISNLTDKIISYEDGNLTDDETIELFQELIDNGMAWSLQGHYGRTAMSLIDAGLCEVPYEELEQFEKKEEEK